MDAFGTAMSFTGPAEAGWQNQGDRGGETIFGVARNYHGDWPEWAAVDAAKSQPGFPASVNNNAELKAAAAQFFRLNFWNAICGDALPLPLACAVFDQAVNFGPPRAIKEMQAALGGIDVDGVMGPATVRAAAASGSGAVHLLLAHRIQRYIEDVQLHPADAVYLPGWIARTILLTVFVTKLQFGGGAS